MVAELREFSRLLSSRLLRTAIERNVADYFDLIVGTSTGGIIALGLGLGLSAKELLAFYEERGPTIFKGNRGLRWLRWLGTSKYSSTPLENALRSCFGDKRLGDSKKRLVIPSLNLENGEVYVYKTAHHPRLERDYKEKAVEVALKTAAAPTYFSDSSLVCGDSIDRWRDVGKQSGRNVCC